MAVHLTTENHKGRTRATYFPPATDDDVPFIHVAGEVTNASSEIYLTPERALTLYRQLREALREAGINTDDTGIIDWSEVA